MSPIETHGDNPGEAGADRGPTAFGDNDNMPDVLPTPPSSSGSNHLNWSGHRHATPDLISDSDYSASQQTNDSALSQDSYTRSPPFQPMFPQYGISQDSSATSQDSDYSARYPETPPGLRRAFSPPHAGDYYANMYKAKALPVSEAHDIYEEANMLPDIYAADGVKPTPLPGCDSCTDTYEAADTVNIVPDEATSLNKDMTLLAPSFDAGKHRELDKIEEGPDDDGCTGSQVSVLSDNNQGSPARSQASLVLKFDDLNAGREADENVSDDAIASPTGFQSKKRKASSELPPAISSKVARNLPGASKFVVGHGADLRGQVTNSGVQRTPLQDSPQIQAMEGIEEAVSDEPRFELDQNGRDVVMAQGNDCQKEQESIGSSINSLGDITTSSTPLPSSVVRATSEPLHSSPTEPACMKRAATMDSAVSVPRRNAARRIPNRKGIFSRSLAERGAISSSTTHGPRIIDAGSGFPVYEATSVATSVIYWPEIQDGDGGETGRTDSTPQPSAGVEEFEKRYLHGGSILEIYQPTTSLAWLEENYDHPIVKLIRKKYGGPLAEMLFPDTPALTIFGPHNEEKMARCAQRLADESRFPVISRPTELDPMLRFRSLSADIGANGTIVDGTFAIDPVVVMTAQITDSGQRSDRDPGTNSASRTGPFNGTDPDAFQRTGAQTDENLIHLSLSTDAGETQSNNHSNRSETGDSYTSRASTYTAVSEDSNPEFNGGAGDPDDDGDGPGSLNDKWEEWVSPVHEKRTDIEIRTPTFPVHLEIVSKTQFKTHPDGHAPFDPRTKFRMTRPQAEAHTKLTVGFHTDEVVIDTSFAELGLKAHRPGSISSHENLDCGFNEPTIAFKHSYTEDDQSKFNASLGISGSIPTPDGSVGYEHGHSTSHTMEAVDSQPVPLYDVRVDLGESYLQKNGASYTSYKYGYRAKRGPFWKTTEAQPCPLDVGFAVGINFFARNKQKIQVPPPQVSCINRNQIHIWVKDPSLRSAMRGFVLLLSTNMPDIRRRSEIGVSGILTCDIETGKPLGYEAVQEDEEVGISMAVVTTKKAKYKPQRKVERTSTLKRLRKKVLRKIRPDPPQITLSPQECVRRGWDVTNNEWRDAIYPELDKHFQRPATPDPYLVAFKIAPFPL